MKMIQSVCIQAGADISRAAISATRFTVLASTLFSLALLSAPVLAAGDPPADARHPAGQATPAGAHTGSAQTAAAMVEGEVRRIQPETGRITLRHGPIPNLDMPPMTMVFEARDPAPLAGLKVGDKVRFQAAAEGSRMILERIEKAD